MATAPTIIQALKPSDVIPWTEIMLKAGRRPMFHGDPGCGKSALMSQIADKMFADKYCGDEDGRRPWFIEIRAAQLDAVDLRGLPRVVDGHTNWAIPADLPTDERGGIVFLDEINRGTEMTQNALFQLCDQGRIGQYRLPDNWCVSAAVNDKDIGARKMSAALLARFVHCDVRTDLDDVMAYGARKDWHPMVLAFLRSFPARLHEFRSADRVSPNPRAWEFISRIMYQNPPISLLPSLIAGAVGPQAAIEFVGYVRLWATLPKIEEILADPKNAPLPVGASCMYAVSAALSRRMTEKTFGNGIVYMERLPVEYLIACVTDAIRRSPDLKRVPLYTKFCIKHSDLVIA